MELLQLAKSHKSHFLKIFIVLIIATPVSSQFKFFIEFCTNDAGNYTTNSTYKNNMDLLLPNLVELASSDPIFGNSSIGEDGIDKAYGIYMCRGDLDTQKCHDCVEESSKRILELCPSQKEAVVWYEECMVRYANRSIFSLEEEVPYGWLNSTTHVTDPEKFGQALGSLMDGLIMQAANNETTRGYAIGNVEYSGPLKVYGHVQCTPDILGIPCEQCLRATLRTTEGCCGLTRVFMIMFFPSCWMRYDLAPFISGQSSPPTTQTTSPPTPLPSPLSPPALPLPPSPPEPLFSTPPPVNDGSSRSMIRSYEDTFIVGLMMLLSWFFT